MFQVQREDECASSAEDEEVLDDCATDLEREDTPVRATTQRKVN